MNESTGGIAPDGPRRGAWRRALAVGGVLALASGFLTFVVIQPAGAVPVGAGSYTTTPVGPLPSGCGAISSNPRLWATANAPSGPIPTNDWWSSILYKRTDCAYSEPLHAHPVSYDALNAGLGFSYNTTPTISGTATGVGEYHYPYKQDFIAGVTGLNSPDVKVDGWTDWTVTPFWSDGARTVKATIGHGLPFAYFQVTGGNAQITTDVAADGLAEQRRHDRLHGRRPRLRRVRAGRVHLDRQRRLDQFGARRQGLLLDRRAADHAVHAGRRPGRAGHELR